MSNEQPYTPLDLTTRGHNPADLCMRLQAAKAKAEAANAELKAAKNAMLAALHDHNGDHDFEGLGVKVTTTGGNWNPDWQKIAAKAIEVAGFQSWQGLVEAENINIMAFQKISAVSRRFAIDKMSDTAGF